MTPAEVADLLAYCAAFDRRTIGKADVLAWQPLLANVDFNEARDAVANHYARDTRWIMPADIRDAVTATHRDRLARHTDPTPKADPDDPHAYRAELLGTRRAVAAGQQEPAQHELTAGPMHPDVAARLKTLGSYVPQTVDEALDAYRPIKAARRAAITNGHPDALSVPCDWCQAPTGEPCRARRVVPGGGATASRRRSTPHPSRIDDARTAMNQEETEA
ncbi:zinc finger domain-containing protein [Streptomyces spinosisporus]|uniref:DNA-binding phage zinc finger domain-containing protein n=1 Tax=Streptomyces spinosisporus TaxID=2927582 RepID=A0ABS9XY07_9ACTN|nr:hypothetical protein [Streptomyces spinosisporus]MCI3246487.1 hypothetical protein [Streptomyces spinosisporus]